MQNVRTIRIVCLSEETKGKLKVMPERVGFVGSSHWLDQLYMILVNSIFFPMPRTTVIIWKQPNIYPNSDDFFLFCERWQNESGNQDQFNLKKGKISIYGPNLS